MLTKAEALNKLNEIKRNTQHNGYMWASDVQNLFYKIYDTYEEQLKAKNERIVELEEAMKPKTCEWKQCDTEYDTHWDGSCGIGWMLAEGTPSYNGMKFCPKCGGKLIEIEPKDNA